LKPLAVCGAETCDACGARSRIHCHFNLKELGHFYLLCLPPFLIGGRAVGGAGWEWLGLYLFCIVGFFGFLEIRIMCSHCPHYAEEGGSLRCWANYGSPKLWAYRPGPMSFTEKFLFIGGLSIVYGFPVLFLAMAGGWFELLLYLIVTGAFGTTLKAFLCSQCMNFACPLNGVGDESRRSFFEKCPEVAQAWSKDEK
jgi:hypothetical protein